MASLIRTHARSLVCTSRRLPTSETLVVRGSQSLVRCNTQGHSTSFDPPNQCFHTKVARQKPANPNTTSTRDDPATIGNERTPSHEQRTGSPGTRGPPQPPQKEAINLETGNEAPTFLGTTNRLPEFNLADKVVLVSGAARGLGLTQAEALLEAGATVYALDRLPEPSPYFATVQERAARTLGSRLHYRQIDVRDVPKLNDTIAEIAATHGRLDGLLHAAGIQQETPALEYTAEDARLMMDVNIVGSFMTAQAAARQMIKYNCPGSIALIASMSGTIANRGLICPAYNASKAGVVQLARNLASEWGEHRIRVNTISPGYIVTDMVEKLFESKPERRTEWASQNMLGRVSMPREYRGAAVFLLSDASSFMTGSDLRMDGGHAAW